MQDHLSWTSGLSIGIYIYCVLALLLALGLWYVRRFVLSDYESLIFGELPEVAGLFQEAQLQLRQVNRQVDRSMEHLDSVFNLVQGLFLALLETRLITWIMKRIKSAPLPVRMVSRKGIEQVFKIVHGRIVQMNKEITEEEATL